MDLVDFDRVFLDFNGTKCGFLKIPKPDLLYLLFSINISSEKTNSISMLQHTVDGRNPASPWMVETL